VVFGVRFFFSFGGAFVLVVAVLLEQPDELTGIVRLMAELFDGRFVFIDIADGTASSELLLAIVSLLD